MCLCATKHFGLAYQALRHAGLLCTDGSIVTAVTPMVNIDDYPDLASRYEVLFSAPELIAVDARRLAHAAGTVKAQNTVVLGAAAPLLPLPSAIVARVSSRLAFAPHAVSDELVQAWTDRPSGTHGQATAAQVFAAPRLVRLDAVHAVTA